MHYLVRNGPGNCSVGPLARKVVTRHKRVELIEVVGWTLPALTTPEMPAE